MGARIVGHQKPCTICKEVKPFSEFYKSNGGKYFKSHCKPCELNRSAKWRAANKEKCKATHLEYLAKNSERMRKYYESWRENNKELRKELDRKYREKNKQKCYAISYAWRKRNKHKVNLWAANYRSRKMMAYPSWANEFFIKESYHLAQLRTKATGIKWEVDHIVPLQSKLVCGLHVENNLRVIPMPLNRKKSNIIWPDMPTENNHAR